MTNKDKEKDKATDDNAVIWMRHRDTGAMRSAPSKKIAVDMQAEGYEPCNADGSPIGTEPAN